MRPDLVEAGIAGRTSGPISKQEWRKPVGHGGLADDAVESDQPVGRLRRKNNGRLLRSPLVVSAKRRNPDFIVARECSGRPLERGRRALLGDMGRAGGGVWWVRTWGSSRHEWGVLQQLPFRPSSRRSEIDRADSVASPPRRSPLVGNDEQACELHGVLETFIPSADPL